MGVEVGFATFSATAKKLRHIGQESEVRLLLLNLGSKNLDEGVDISIARLSEQRSEVELVVTSTLHQALGNLSSTEELSGVLTSHTSSNELGGVVIVTEHIAVECFVEVLGRLHVVLDVLILVMLT